MQGSAVPGGLPATPDLQAPAPAAPNQIPPAPAAAPGQAPTIYDLSENPVPGADKPARSVLVTLGNKKMAALNGKAAPLIWADGITRVADLDRYKQTGMNVVVVHLYWQPSDDGTVDLGTLQAARGFAEAAAARGLNVVYSLPPAPTGFERSFRTTGDSEPYFLIWSTWVNSVIETLRGTPNLVGWMLPNDPRALPYVDDIGFSRWIKSNFASIEILNRQWGTSYESLDDVTLQGVALLLTQFQGPPPINSGLTEDELRERYNGALSPDKRPKVDKDLPFHPAALALAQFRREAYRALVGRWAQTVKSADPLHFVMSGRLPDYAQLLTLPPNVDVSVPDMQPGIAENDLATHNPQAIDIARRGGRFAATPVLTTSPLAELPADTLPLAMPSWIRSAVAHGASGLVFSSWPDMAANENLRSAIESTLAEIDGSPEKELWNAAPVSTAAVLLTPLADGYTLQIGRDPQTGQPVGEPRGLYGFGNDLVRGEPSNLVWALRWGTAFGSVDFLAPEDLSALPLSGYSTVLMPQALSLGEDSMIALNRFVGEGGVAVTDIGMGAAQVGWQVQGVPPRLASLFGVAGPVAVHNLSFNLQGAVQHPLFPTFSRASNGRQGILLTDGDGPGGAAFTSPTAFALPVDGTVPVALAQRLPIPIGELQNGKPRLTAPMDASLTLHPFGDGYAVYAPFRLWSSWGPANGGYSQFHGDLFARGSSLVQMGASAFVPAPGANADRPLYPQMINYPSAIALLNHSPLSAAGAASPPPPDAPADAPSADGPADAAPSPPGTWQYSIMQTPGCGNFLWSNTMCFLPASADVAADAPRRPAPTPLAQTYDVQPRLITLYAAVKAQDITFAHLLPIAAQNLGGGNMVAAVAEDKTSSAKIAVWPNGSNITPENGRFNVVIGETSAARVTVYDSPTGYRVAPNSTHRVTITEFVSPNTPAISVKDNSKSKDKDKKKSPDGPLITTQTVTADADGVLRIELTTRGALVEIAPQL